MFVFIWELADGKQGLTDYFHTGGGLVVVAPTLERALTLARQNSTVSEQSAVFDGMAPMRVIPVADGTGVQEEVLVFPDVGCCY